MKNENLIEFLESGKLKTRSGTDLEFVSFRNNPFGEWERGIVEIDRGDITKFIVFDEHGTEILPTPTELMLERE